MKLYTVILIMQVYAMLFTALNSHDGAYTKSSLCILNQYA